MATPTDFFRDASGNFGANTTLFNTVASGYTPPVESAEGASAAYNSRVRSTLANGAGPNSDPARAPWSFTDFVFGRKSVVAEKEGTGRKFSLVRVLLIGAVLYFVWKMFVKR